MASAEALLYRPADLTAIALSLANAIGTVTIAAPAAGRRVFITGYTLSYNLAVATAHVPDIVSGALVVERLHVPAAAFAPRTVEFARPFMCPDGTSVVITVPAAGASVISTLLVRHFIA